MSLCRTCLSKNDLRPIFPDKDHVSARTKQLYAVTGIKIEVNDDLPQLICVLCINLINAALQLREISSKSNEILKSKLKSNYGQNYIKIPDQKGDTAEHDIQKQILKQISDRKELKLKIKSEKNTKSKNVDIKKEYSIRIEDFESSDDNDSMNDILLEDLADSAEKKRVCIEDYESSDSFEGDIEALKGVSKDCYEYNWDIKEKELLERERRKMESREQDNKLMSLAVTPYDPGGPLRCTLCSKVVRNAQNFKCHAKTHFEPQNACEDCGKKFINLSHMRYHQQRVHGRRKRLACTQCAYRAVDPQQMQNHTRACHSGERPFTCDVCGDSFRMRRNIAQHMRKHFGVRNLQCERCPAMFRSRSELTGHQNKVHFHIYTYLCYLCTETYKRPASVKKHLVNVHGVPKNRQLPIKCVKTRRSFFATCLSSPTTSDSDSDADKPSFKTPSLVPMIPPS